MGRYIMSSSFTYERAVCHLEVRSQNVLKRKSVPNKGVKPIMFANKLIISDKTASVKWNNHDFIYILLFTCVNTVYYKRKWYLYIQFIERPVSRQQICGRFSFNNFFIPTSTILKQKTEGSTHTGEPKRRIHLK